MELVSAWRFLTAYFLCFTPFYFMQPSLMLLSATWSFSDSATPSASLQPARRSQVSANHVRSKRRRAYYVFVFDASFLSALLFVRFGGDGSVPVFLILYLGGSGPPEICSTFFFFVFGEVSGPSMFPWTSESGDCECRRNDLRRGGLCLLTPFPTLLSPPLPFSLSSRLATPFHSRTSCKRHAVCSSTSVSQYAGFQLKQKEWEAEGGMFPFF